MSGLQAFFAQNAEQAETLEKVVSKRFKDENGEPMKWQFEAVSGDKEEAIRKACTKKVQHPANKKLYIPETDHNLFLTKLTVASVKFPDLFNAELQDSYGVKTPEELLGKMLKPGELAEAKQAAQEVNGYEIEFDDLVEEAKN